MSRPNLSPPRSSSRCAGSIPLHVALTPKKCVVLGNQPGQPVGMALDEESQRHDRVAVDREIRAQGDRIAMPFARMHVESVLEAERGQHGRRVHVAHVAFDRDR
jgi:hypothetical protein